MAANKEITLTLASGSPFSIRVENIIDVVDFGTGSTVTYTESVGISAANRKVNVTEDPAAILVLTGTSLVTVNNVNIPCVISAWVTYGTLVGTFVIGEVVKIGTGATTAQVTGDNGTVLQLTSISGGAITALDNILGLTSNATAVVTNTTVPSAANVPAADQYTYNTGIFTQYINPTRIKFMTPFLTGGLTKVSYDKAGATYEALYLTQDITTLSADIQAGL